MPKHSNRKMMWKYKGLSAESIKRPGTSDNGRYDANFTLENSLFETVKWTKNANPDNYSYSG